MPAAIPFIVGATAVAGIGMQIYGMSQQASAQKDMAYQQRQQIALQQQAEAQRKQAMELDARRKQMEIFRQQQRARSMSLATATGQGAQYGSGLQGAYGQESGQAGFQALGVTQNLEIGRNLFGINSQISDSRIAYSQAQSSAATGGAISALGGTLISDMGQINSLYRTYGPSTAPGIQFNPGSAYNPGLAGSLY